MSNGIRTCIVIIVFALLLIAQACTQKDQAPDPLAYTPTGDVLWDTYAQALLEYLDKAPYGSGTWGLPDRLLDSWEAEFGADARYWQLRYWNAVQQAPFDINVNSLAAEFLVRGSETCPGDAMTKMLIYKYRNDAAWDSWTWCDVASGGDRPTFGELDIPFSPPDIPWTKELELEVAKQLVTDCPDESWAWYTSAMKHFDYGDWEVGLDDMRRGNSAPNNRVPLPFPASFVTKRVAEDLHCGSEISAGIVFKGLLNVTLPNFTRLKDHATNQEVRLATGAAISELEPWHLYTSRFGSMEGAGAIHWLVALVIQRRHLKYLLVQTPESLTIDQREALWGLYGRSQKIKELARYDLMNEQLDPVDRHDAISSILLDYGIDMELVDFSPLGFTVDTEKLGLDQQAELELLTNLKLAKYQAYYQYVQPEYGTVYRKVSDRFNMLATFDFETLSWPETN